MLMQLPNSSCSPTKLSVTESSSSSAPGGPSAVTTHETCTAYQKQPDRHTHTHTHNHFTALLDFVRDHPGKLAPGRLNQSGFTGARDSEWQWHQLGHMQTCTLTQTQPCQHPTTQFFTGQTGSNNKQYQMYEEQCLTNV